jgi:hypothetical protein
MAVYVDELMRHGPGSYHGPDGNQAARVGAKNDHLWCHLVADSEEELHAFASRLGMKRTWFQGDHYDLTPKKRAIALSLGAQGINRKAFVEKLRERRRREWRAKQDAVVPGVLREKDPHQG